MSFSAKAVCVSGRVLGRGWEVLVVVVVLARREIGFRTEVVYEDGW